MAKYDGLLGQPILEVEEPDKEGGITFIFKDNRFMFIKAVDGKITGEAIADLIGLEAAADVVDKINAIQTPPNTDATILKKGSSNPLVDTGHLKQSIRHEVRTEKS